MTSKLPTRHQARCRYKYMVVGCLRLPLARWIVQSSGMSPRSQILLTIMLMAVLLGGCGENIDPNEPQGFIQAKGSDTMVNAVQMVTEEFMKEYPHIFVAVTGGGSGVGIASLINKTCDIASASREMKPKEIEM